jgi:hypothetical protein
MVGLRDHDWSNDPIFDSGIVSHGFTPYMRDYDVVADVPALRRDGSGSYIEGRYRYRFTHCVEAYVQTKVPPGTWQKSWTDEFIDYSAWKAAGEPDGFVWGVEWAEAYPGVETVRSSESAASWSQSLGKQMHSIRIETNAYVISLVCHDLVVTKLASGDPTTGELRLVE